MRWYIRRLDSLLNPRYPRPYFAGLAAGTMARIEARWSEGRDGAKSYHIRKLAFDIARDVWGHNWRELVRVVRVRTTGAGCRGE